MSRIEKLTKEQEELMPDVRDEWINFCLSGDTSIDQKECSDGIEWLYLLAKLKKPIFLAFAEGPLAAQGIANIFPNVLKAIGIKKPVWNSVENSVRNSVWNSVENSVRNSVRNSVWNSVENSVGNSVGNSVRNSVRNSVWNSVENSVRNSVRNSVEKYEPPYCGLGWWSGWFAFCDYFEKLGISTEDFKRFRKWVKSGAWDVLWFENLCVVTCRPSMIRKDAQGRLHCDDGPAAKWPSGEEYWFLHGVNVSEKIVMKTDELTVEEISNEKNSEISRAIAEKLGWDRYMGTLGTVLIDKWFDPSKSLHYELYDFKSRKFSLMPRLLKMESPEILDGTRPYYIEPVDPKLNSCQSARKWQFKLLDGEWPTVEECNKNPELVFEVEA